MKRNRPPKPMFSLKRLLDRKQQRRASAPATPANPALTNMHPWATLSDLLGTSPMRTNDLVAYFRGLNREDTLFRLARLAAVLANSRGSVMGDEAQAWTRDLLLQGRACGRPLEVAVADALVGLPRERAIAHGHVVCFLQLMAAVHGSLAGRLPTDGELAFLMLAANDHIPEWAPGDPAVLTEFERVVGVSFLCTTFNRSDDPMRSLLRIVDIMGHRSERQFPDPRTWDDIQREAFGTSFDEYVEMFVAPMHLVSKTWGSERPPLVPRELWRGRNPRERALYERWLNEASMTLEEAAVAFGGRPMASGLPGLPGEFFRKPFVRKENLYLGLSPWHVRDHAVLGTWAKLNAASKRVLGTSSSQVFSSAFGYSFERWCAALAQEADGSGRFKDTLILPSAPGADDEIEDVVMCDGNYVAMFSAKASLVREDCLKAADHVGDVVGWLRRFFFEDEAEAKSRRYRGGAALLLDLKVQRLRAGDYENRGLRRDAIVLPCIISFDNVGESGVLYRWLSQECARLGILSARPSVRPLTVLTPEDYEGLLALGVGGLGICRLLAEKTRPALAEVPLDKFLDDRARGGIMRLPSMRDRFKHITDRSVARLQEATDALAAAERDRQRGQPEGAGG